MSTMRINRPSALLALLVLCAAMLPAHAAQVEGIRVWQAPDHTRLVFDLSARVEYSLFTLDNPQRVVIDIRDSSTTLQLEKTDLRDSPIRRVRGAARNGSDLRLVLDLARELKPNAFLLPANRQYGERLVVDLYDEAQPRKPVKTAATREGRRDIVIAIDPGHGGEDPGAIGPKRQQEKAIVMQIAKKIQQQFNNSRGYRAELIRDGDYYVGLGKRRELARELRADFFMSIHADAFTDKRVSGGSVYTLSQRGASSASAKFLAESENETDLIGGVDLGDKDDVLAGVLLDLSMNAKLEASTIAGKMILAEMGRVAKLHKNTVEYAGFAVLKTPDIPSVLIETGFISNAREARRLSTRGHQLDLAGAIVKGTKRYFDEYALEGTWVHYWNQQAASNTPREHTIQPGETLSGLAVRYAVSTTELRRYNKLRDDRIRVGQVLKIPPKS